MKFCQSCSMPLTDSALAGTEKDGTLSSDYCKYCYKDGEFTDPKMTLEKMQLGNIKRMEEDKIPEDIIEAAVTRLPLLKRWKTRSN